MGTRVSIELTDDEVADLRQNPPYTGPGWAIPIINRVYDALPPEPVKVTVELPVTLAEKLRSGRFVVSQDRTDSAVDLWRLVERALKNGGAA